MLWLYRIAGTFFILLNILVVYMLYGGNKDGIEEEQKFAMVFCWYFILQSTWIFLVLLFK